MSEGHVPKLGEVGELFRRSQKTLDELRERLKALVLEEEIASQASAAMHEAATALAGTATKMTAIVDQLETARAALVDSLATAQQFLEGIDLDDVRREIQELHGEWAEFRQEVIAGLTELADRIPEVDAARADAEAAREELQVLKARIPERTRKKLGL